MSKQATSIVTAVALAVGSGVYLAKSSKTVLPPPSTLTETLIWNYPLAISNIVFNVYSTTNFPATNVYTYTNESKVIVNITNVYEKSKFGTLLTTTTNHSFGLYPTGTMRFFFVTASNILDHRESFRPF